MSDTPQTPLYKNELIHQTSPYLLQHAHNPVHWYPWSSLALDRARQEDKLILLSIGYSACHWCHVMAHESFEDVETAQVMNDLYINIKVDREERPDLDRIYQFAHQVLTQRGGGWPLTMILTPQDQTPFFAGTYFPKKEKFNTPAFVDVLRRVDHVYRHNLNEVNHQNQALLEILQQANSTNASEITQINGAPLDAAKQQLENSFDNQYSGFGKAPKFPHPTNIERLLRHWWGTKNNKAEDVMALKMAVDTLSAMASGGMYDQLGGGFCRYSVDEQWMIPHFEKMLYDNGPLLYLYVQAWLATGDQYYRKIALETAEWAMREMQSDQGGYFSSLDADSEGEEGKFYVWNPEQAKQSLDADEYELFAVMYGLDKEPNFEGLWHLHTYNSLESLATKWDVGIQQANELLQSAKQKLFRIREDRIHPGRDDKVLVSWNALLIKAMAAAGRICDRNDFIESAQQALDFIRSSMWQDGRLLATYKDNKSHLMAYLDDYVFLIDAILELLQARWRDGDLDFAIELADCVLQHFEDKHSGGFYFTADDHERLIQRPKVLLDDSLPAGNGIAAFVLQRLGHILGENRYLEAAENTLKSAWESIQRTPYAHNALLLALEEYLYGFETIIVRGAEQDLPKWISAGGQTYAPRRVLIAIPNQAENLPGLLAQRASKQSPVAYVCKGQTCRKPISNLAEFTEICKDA